jgi:hypothetical protein
MPTPSTPKTYITWSNAETDALIEWLNANYASYCNGTKSKVYAALAETLGTKTKVQVENKVKRWSAMTRRPLTGATQAGVAWKGLETRSSLSFTEGAPDSPLSMPSLERGLA